MNRQTPTSKRSPSILVTDVRHEEAHSAPFVRRRLNSVSVDRLLSNTSEVPSAQRRAPLRRQSKQLRTKSSSHRVPTTIGEDSGFSIAAQTAISTNANERTPLLNRGPTTSTIKHQQPGIKHVPRLSKPLPSRQSKQSQRLVLIPNAETEPNACESHTHSQQDDSDSNRVTSYLISEGIMLSKVAAYLKSKHRARVRLYGEALFADYLLPIIPGNGVDFRIQSSVGDNRSMERMIDISEQRDHHYEYFSATGEEEEDPSEPQDFSPRVGNAIPPPAVSEPNQEGNDESKKEAEMEESKESESAESKHEQVTAAVEQERRMQSYLSHAEIFIFNYGVVVFWNFTETQEKQVLADLCIGNEDLVIKPASDQDIQSEELRFKYELSMDTKPKIFNDMITLNSNSHMLKLAMAHAMAQSTILCCFEDRMQAHLNDVRGVPKRLALTGKLGMNREQLLKISGRLFKLRVDVNLSSNVLDIPEFFWDSEPSLFPLFNALREYLEIDQRVLVLNERQSVFLELTSILSDSIAEFNMDRITIIVIWLIVLSICVSLTEIFVRFLFLKRAGL